MLATTNWVSRNFVKRSIPDLGRKEYVGGTTTDFDYSDFAFGFSIIGDIVKIQEGYIFHGIKPAIYVNWYLKEVTEDRTYFFVRYNFINTAQILSSTTFPQNTADWLIVLLYEFRLIDNAVSLGTIHHIGDIIIPGAFAG